ncbi:hypothetical protein GQF03_02845 [Sneathiella chungangensis]|uniref:Uncharacterized protein n=1 Tax=Sneathiella chungangensis TaxID=1418234 RepID=A0A845MC89_9PROT|nr:hypothetical protein [Sneathiella chungangensis]MZR21261.1 hypothetical protein [Sneathiella chungangensis]
MRENFDEKLEGGLDAASLSRIKVRRPKDAANTPRKVKSGDITDRLQALAEELEASKPARKPAPAPEIKKSAEDKPVPVTAKKQSDAPAKAAAKPVKAKKPAPAPRKKIESAPKPVSAVPPRRANWARPAATSGWQKKAVAPDILSYWMEIRDGNRYPTWQNLDTAKIGRHWPNCTLVHCDRVAGRLQLENGFANELRAVMREENPHREINSEIEFSPMIVDWVLSLARDVANTGKPTHGTEYFPSTFDEIPLRVIALPLSENQVDIDHVLCYVQRLD